MWVWCIVVLANPWGMLAPTKGLDNFTMYVQVQDLLGIDNVKQGILGSFYNYNNIPTNISNTTFQDDRFEITVYGINASLPSGTSNVVNFFMTFEDPVYELLENIREKLAEYCSIYTPDPIASSHITLDILSLDKTDVRAEVTTDNPIDAVTLFNNVELDDKIKLHFQSTQLSSVNKSIESASVTFQYFNPFKKFFTTLKTPDGGQTIPFGEQQQITLYFRPPPSPPPPHPRPPPPPHPTISPFPPLPSFPPNAVIVANQPVVQVTLSIPIVDQVVWVETVDEEKTELTDLIATLFIESLSRTGITLSLDAVRVRYIIVPPDSGGNDDSGGGGEVARRRTQSTQEVVVNTGTAIVVVEIVIPPTIQASTVVDNLNGALLEVRSGEDSAFQQALGGNFVALGLGSPVVTSTTIRRVPLIASPPPPSPENVTPYTDLSLIFIATGACVGLFLIIFLARECDSERVRLVNSLFTGVVGALFGRKREETEETVMVVLPRANNAVVSGTPKSVSST